MSALEILMKLIKESEGCSLKAYKCPAGVVTIGWGQTKGIKEGMVWTQQQADEDLIKTMPSAKNPDPRGYLAMRGKKQAEEDAGMEPTALNIEKSKKFYEVKLI